MKNAARFLLAPLACLAVFWRAPFVWFRIDDFAWLNLPNLPLSYALFEPFAQGTIRVFSERLYFLTLTELFGITSWPFRAAALGVWFLDLALIQLIGERITGSRAAGVLAALLWTVSPALVTPLVWASSFNEVLIAFVILGAFYARLRGWKWTEALLFLAGFGVLEIVVVYPALVLLYNLVHRKPWRDGLWMFVPAAAFGAAHLFLIPKTDTPVYRLYFDSRLPATLWQYFKWATGVRRLIVLPVTAAAGTFALWRIRQGDRRPLFFLGWFLLLLAPVLPLANHIIDYYLTVPGIGLAWLAGWALASAWNAGWTYRAPATALAAVYATACIMNVQEITAWHLRVTSEIRIAIRAVEGAVAKYPGTAIAITGMNDEGFLNSAPHRPFGLVGASQVWLLPGSDRITENTDFGDLSSFRTTTEDLLREVEAGRARVLDVSNAQARDVTTLWAKLTRASR